MNTFLGICQIIIIRNFFFCENHFSRSKLLIYLGTKNEIGK